MANSRISLNLAAGLALALAAAPAFAATANDPASPPKVTLAQAKVIALAAQSGQLLDAALETDAAGRDLRYSFDIQASAATHEIEVDANTGAIVQNDISIALPDAPARHRAPRSM
jgi:hypothetical protein